MRKLAKLILAILILFATIPGSFPAVIAADSIVAPPVKLQAVPGNGEVELSWLPGDELKKMLFVGSGVSADVKTIAHLDTLGFLEIDFALAYEVETEDAEGYDIIFVGESSGSGDIDQKFMSLPIPVVYSKGWVLDNIYLSSAGAGEYGDVDHHTTINIVESEHPLAAGLSGSVEVYSEAGKVNFGTPGEDATIIATVADDDSKATIFAHEEGTKNLNGDTIPARQVSTFLFAGQEDYMTEEGWKLLDEGVKWALGMEDLQREQTFQVKRSTEQGGPYEIVASGVVDTTYTDTEVENGTPYYYVITTVTSEGESAPSEEIRVVPVELLPAPTGLTATVGNEEVSLRWDAVEDATSYTVKRSTVNEEGSYEVIEAGITETEFIDTTVKNDVEYYYVVLAANDVTESMPSEPISVTPIDTRPVITLDQEDTHVNERTFTVSGSMDRESIVMVNGETVELQSDLRFQTKVQLELGENNILVNAVDSEGEQAAPVELLVVYDTEAPTITLDELDGEKIGNHYKTKYNPYPISGIVSEPGQILVNGEVVEVSEDLTFYTEVELRNGVNHIKISAVDLAGNQSKTQKYQVRPDKETVPPGPIEIVSTVVKNVNTVEVTFNGHIANFDPSDLELQSALGEWDSLNPRLTPNFTIKNIEIFENSVGQTVVVFETEETINLDGTFEREVVEDPHNVPYLRANYYSSDLQQSIEQADNLLTWQMDHGGWDKNRSDTDYTRPWDGVERKSSSYSFIHGVEAGTIDNDATIDEILFLALMYKETGYERYKDSALRGIHYVLESQYETGGFPQVYPLVGGYPDAATYNDDAMIRVLKALKLVAEKQYPFNTDLVSDELISEVEEALDLALEYILHSQIDVDGKLTAWGQQHDPFTYEPVMGRAFEHPSITGAESIAILKYLMALPNQTEEVQAAIEGALNWYEEAKVEGIRYVRNDPNNQYFYDDPDSTIWYRFYQIGTNLPIFSGRDGVITHNILDIEKERRDGYQWAGTYGRDILRVANTTGYFENRIYVEVIGDSSTNIAGETLTIGDLHRVEAYEE